MAQRPCVGIGRTELTHDGVARGYAGRRQREEGAAPVADRKLDIERRGAVTRKFRCEGNETMGMAAGVETRIERRLVVEFAGDVGPVDAGPCGVDLDFAAMTAQLHAFHMAVGIEKPAGNKQPAALDAKDIVDPHAHGERQAGNSVGPVEAVGGRAHP